MGVRCTWLVPFVFAEWLCECLSDWLARWAFLDVLERISHLAIVVAVMFYIMEAPERQKVKQYYAWQIINSLKGSRTDGGRSYAIRDLLQDRVSLAGIELIDAILPHMDFKDAYLYQGRFERSELLDADFQRAVLSGSRFNNSLLNRANFSEAQLKDVTFVEACLERANFSDADLKKAYFYRAQITNAVFVNSNLSGATLERADLTGAVFATANLGAATLESADLKDVDFSGADLRRAVLRNCVRWEEIKSIRLANIMDVREPPPGFLEWAREHGAVQIEDDLEWKRLLDRKH